jgi:hypothetical protein
MTPGSPQEASTEQLVEQFIVLSVQQDETLKGDDTEGYNRLFDKLDALERELEARVGDQRLALVRLYDHPNAQVRLNAATATLAVAPQAARRMLEIIRHSREYPQAADAGMTIFALDREASESSKK